MTDYEKLKEIYDEINGLITMRVSSSTPDFRAWKVKAKRFYTDTEQWKMNLLKELKKIGYSVDANTLLQ